MDSHRLAETLRIWHPRLRAISAADAEKVVGTRWTRKQVIGHLIDSAANNHQRFIHLQSGDLAGYPDYVADPWVERGAYARQPWADLVTLWHLYNAHLVHVIANIPDAAKSARWIDKDVDLAYLVHDYVDHLVGHLQKVA